MNLEEIKKRFEKVADQSWEYAPEVHCYDSQVLCSFSAEPYNTTLILASYHQHANGNGEFIGHAKDDIEFLLAKIERMQKAILEQISLDRLKETVDTEDTPWRKQLSLRVKDLQNFFDKESYVFTRCIEIRAQD